MLDRLRGKLDSSISQIGKMASSVLPSPTAWTAMGLIFAALSAYAYTVPSRTYELLAASSLLISGFLDVIDGAVARYTSKISKRGSFLDSTLDRVGEVAVYLGILVGGYSLPLAVLLAMAFSLLVSYTRSKADSLGISLAGVGIGERSERLLILAVASLLGLLAYGVMIVAALAAVTFVERTYRVTRALK